MKSISSSTGLMGRIERFSRFCPSGRPSTRGRRRLNQRAALALVVASTFATQLSFAAIYPDKHGNAGDIQLDPPVVNSVFGGVDYSVAYTATDSEGTKTGEYLITSDQLPGRDLSPTDDSVLRLFVTDTATQTAAELVYRNNPNAAPAMPILTLFDCTSGDCVEEKVYDDPQSGCWVISDQYDIENYPIELLDARVILGLLEDEQLLALPNSVDGTGNWAEFMMHHRINFEESKFRGDIDFLGDEQSDLLTSRMIDEIESHNDCSYDDWLVRHWCTEAECPPDVGIQHGALSFMTEHTKLIESMSETLFNKHLNDWPTSGDTAAFAFPFGRMPMWKVDHDHEFGSGTPCTPDGPSDNCHHLPPYWDQVIDGYGRVAPGVCDTVKLGPLAIPGCYHDFPVNAYLPTLTSTPGAQTGPGETMNLGASECAQVVGPDGFVDRPCTDPADYAGIVTQPEFNYHNPLHGFIGGAFAAPPTTAGTMVFWTFHTQVSSNGLANWRHAQKRDVGVPTSTCSAEAYEAEDMFQSTGGPVTDGWNIWSNGYVSTLHTFTPGPTQINVVAKGEQASNVWPHMIVSVDGIEVGNTSVNTPDWSNYSFQFNASAGSHEIRVSFDNDAFQPPSADRNLLVDAVYVDCTLPPAGDPCDSFCSDPTDFSWSESYQSGQLGNAPSCRQTTQAIVGGVCGNFTGGKQLLVNGIPVTCDNQNWTSVPAPVNGGYCIQSSAGDYAWSYFALW